VSVKFCDYCGKKLVTRETQGVNPYTQRPFDQIDTFCPEFLGTWWHRFKLRWITHDHYYRRNINEWGPKFDSQTGDKKW
jgi:hypothetical protein